MSKNDIGFLINTEEKLAIMTLTDHFNWLEVSGNSQKENEAMEAMHEAIEYALSYLANGGFIDDYPVVKNSNFYLRILPTSNLSDFAYRFYEHVAEFSKSIGVSFILDVISQDARILHPDVQARL
ncbi:DUF6572 domain-containing protein [Aquirhabdus parva]|nr:DUF6572 domain-containing protein [Aquirhabdus parva]